LYDIRTKEILTHKTEILDYIACPPDERRVIPDFLKTVYDVNREIVDGIKSRFAEMEQRSKTDSSLFEYSRDRSTKFVITMLRDIDERMSAYLIEFPEDNKFVNFFELVKDRLLSAPLTKRRLSQLRKVWKDLKNTSDWKKALTEIDGFLMDKRLGEKVIIEPFKPKELRLVAIDFIS